ncbi:MAG TPA: metallophosphoesterase family protein [Chitinophagales bacterium]|nr:metallophosphoesterase family protein [Chitinophagales bacterium]
MKRIGVLSDTHSYIDLTLRSFFEDCDEIWHAGDIGDMKVMEELEKWKPIKAVHGNIDSGDVKRIYPEYHIIDVEGKRFLLIHIAGRIGKYNTTVTDLLKKYEGIDCIVCGHSHILKVQNDLKFNILYLNPGAAGKHGFHLVCTALKFDVDGTNMKNLQLIELGKRGAI